MYGLVKYSIIIESLPEIESFEFSPLVLKRVINSAAPRGSRGIYSYCSRYAIKFVARAYGPIGWLCPW